MVVHDELSKFGVQVISVELGEAEISGTLSIIQRALLEDRLKRSGLELMSDKRIILTERIKNTIVEVVYFDEEIPKMKFSVLLADKLGYDYTYLANLFSEVTGNTIEHFFILHRIARVKELLVNEDMTLTEIAYKLHYSSVAHLANQFKKVTGYTASHFKSITTQRLQSIEMM
jgi:AraC-like DNA-binding protein